MPTDLAPLREAVHATALEWFIHQNSDTYNRAESDRLADVRRRAVIALRDAAKANAVEAFQDAGEFIPKLESTE